jgi:hypothetical protein
MFVGEYDDQHGRGKCELKIFVTPLFMSDQFRKHPRSSTHSGYSKKRLRIHRPGIAQQLESLISLFGHRSDSFRESKFRLAQLTSSFPQKNHIQV